MSSTNEGMPFVMLMALGAGLPVVATDVSGTRACVDDGGNGRVVPPGDPVALAGALAEVLADRPGMERMSALSRRLAEERFDERRMIDDTEKVLRECLRNRGR
jgi:glycosyltransferase involved in cell wall biosynthesis